MRHDYIPALRERRYSAANCYSLVAAEPTYTDIFPAKLIVGQARRRAQE
jgi:hypothetical protein